MAEDIFVRMYEMQQQLQRMVPGGVSAPTGERPWSPDDMDNIRTNVLALLDEIHEFMRETRWKPWTSGPAFVNPAAHDEIVDAFHFFMNLMIVIGMTPHDLFAGYQRKHLINVSRHTSRDAYTGHVIKVDPINQGQISA